MEGKKKRIRKIISTIVAVALVVTMLPAADYAYGTTTAYETPSDINYDDDEIIMPEVTEEQFFAIEKEWKADQKRRKLHRATLSGSGSVSDPYLIYTADDLQSMTDNDNSCYKLMRDINLKGRSWRPPGYYYWYPFMGYLDGNGHKVTNLFVGGTSQDAWNINAGGLFGYLEGRVENLGVETVKAQGKGVDFFGITGGIAGVANAPAEIINCYFNGYVAGASYVGGLVGIAYPGTVIENCCALGMVDMSQGYEYLNDNEMKWGQDIYNATMDVVIYGASVVGDAANGFLEGGTSKAILEAVLTGFLDAPQLLQDLTSTDYLTGIRKCSIGGLVGLNYGRIYNSYAANKLYNVKTTMASTTKMGAIAARHIEGNEGVILDCYYNKDLTEHDGGLKEYGKTTSQLKSKGTSGLETKQWNYSAKTLSKKSTDGYPLPKINKIKRNKRTVTEKGEKVVYEPEIYYQSRVLMRTREDFTIGTPYTSKNGTESIKCTICAELKKSDRHRAVTGIYQRGTKSMPYHVHDIDSMLKLQDYKECNYILCNDIDFKVSDGTNTVQKYWWPVGKTHFSPSKGYFKGNTSYVIRNADKAKDPNYYRNKNYKINGKVSAKEVTEPKYVFTIKNLTVQSNRHAGLFACLRGTFSDINVELASGYKWKNWKDGIRGAHGNTVGISTVGNVSSAGGVAGDVVTGGVIRNCVVGGGNFGSLDIKKSAQGYVSSTLRGGGVAGFLDRGAKIYNVKTYISVDVNNYDLHYGEDRWNIGIKVAAAGATTTKEIIALIKNVKEFKKLVSDIKKSKSNKYLDDDTKDLIDLANENMGLSDISFKASPFKYTAQGGHAFISSILQSICSVVEPLFNLWLEEYAIVCNGYIVGENYGNVDDCTAYEAKGVNNPWWRLFWPYDNAIGFQGFENYADYSYAEIQNAADQVLSGETSFSSFSMAQSKQEQYNKEHNIQVTTLATLKKGISGAGTEDEPIKVASEADLQKIADLLDDGYDFEGVYIEQIDDIKLTESFECMGLSSQTPFKGVYNGNECVIEGLKVENNSSAALFYKLDGALVYNLTIEEGRFIGAEAAALAVEAVNESMILNCGSNSYVYAEKDEEHPENSRAAGLVLKLQDSYIGNSYVNWRVEAGHGASGIADIIEGTSELANCYVSALVVAPYCAGIGKYVEWDSQCCMYNCYWPEEYDAVMDYDNGNGDYWQKEINNHAYSRDYMKSSAFVDLLNRADNTISSDCYIDMSHNREWTVVEGSYPEFKVNYCSLKVIQPAQGKIKAEYGHSLNGKTTWHEVNTIRLPIGTSIRLTLQNLPENKALDYWKRNGVLHHNSGYQYIGGLHENSIFEVVLKDVQVVPLKDQTRTLSVMVPEHGKLTLKISDVFENDGSEETIPSSTVVIEGNTLRVDKNTITVNGKSDGEEIYSDSMLQIFSQITSEGKYILAIPYGAKIEPVYADSTCSYWLKDYIINDGQMNQKQPGEYECYIYENSNLYVAISETKPKDNSDTVEEGSSILPN